MFGHHSFFDSIPPHCLTVNAPKVKIWMRSHTSKNHTLSLQRRYSNEMNVKVNNHRYNSTPEEVTMDYAAIPHECAIAGYPSNHTTNKKAGERGTA